MYVGVLSSKKVERHKAALTKRMTTDILCPITFAPFCDIKYPVTFHTFPHQSYECEALVRWLLVRNINPMTNLPVVWKKTPLEILGPHVLCRTPTRVQDYLESTLGYHERETMLQYFTNNQRRFAWLCVYLMMMIFALIMSLAYHYYGAMYNGVWTTLYYAVNLVAIAHGYMNSIGSMNADTRLVMKAGVCFGIAGIQIFIHLFLL